MILCKAWHDSCLQGSIKHFMCTLWMKWSWLGMWGKGVRPHTEYDLAKQLNSETVKK